jgi:DNA-binding IclR family transcriptional regulator
VAGNVKTVGASVTSRALAILGAFDALHSGLSLSDLSRRTGIPLATAHRLIGELSSWGALSRGPDGRYRIGLRIWELGALTPTRTGLRDAALPSLLSLSELSRKEVRLVVADGEDAVCVEHLVARDDPGGTDLTGLRCPLEESACGIALLAHREAGGATVQRCLPLYRRYGCVVRAEEPRAGRQTLAMPVVGDDLAAVAAIGLTLPGETAIGHGRELLIAAAAGIQRALSRQRAVAA